MQHEFISSLKKEVMQWRIPSMKLIIMKFETALHFAVIVAESVIEYCWLIMSENVLSQTMPRSIATKAGAIIHFCRSSIAKDRRNFPAEKPKLLHHSMQEPFSHCHCITSEPFSIASLWDCTINPPQIWPWIGRCKQSFVARNFFYAPRRTFWVVRCGFFPHFSAAQRQHRRRADQNKKKTNTTRKHVLISPPTVFLLPPKESNYLRAPLNFPSFAQHYLFCSLCSAALELWFQTPCEYFKSAARMCWLLQFSHWNQSILHRSHATARCVSDFFRGILKTAYKTVIQIHAVCQFIVSRLCSEDRLVSSEQFFFLRSW
jgi:hypothetical protein